MVLSIRKPVPKLRSRTTRQCVAALPTGGSRELVRTHHDLDAIRIGGLLSLPATVQVSYGAMLCRRALAPQELSSRAASSGPWTDDTGRNSCTESSLSFPPILPMLYRVSVFCLFSEILGPLTPTLKGPVYCKGFYKEGRGALTGPVFDT